MANKLYEEESVRAIANAIREKNSSTDTYKIAEMAQAIKDIPSGSKPIIAAKSEHVDANGVWHKPEEWPDIESITIPDNESRIYLLYANHLTGYSFCRVKVYGSGMTWRRGTVTNGEFVADTSSATVGSGGYITIDLEQLEGDYTVIEIKGSTSILQCYTVSWNGTGMAFDAKYNTCLMRYGRMPKGTNITFQCYFLESDNIMDFAKNISNTTLTLTSAYIYNYKMCRWRHSGWNIVGNKFTTCNSMFLQCYSLIDVDNLDFSSWVTATTTNVSNMFNNCLSLKDPINVSNWVVTNVTTLASLFYYCLNVPDIIGLETWSSLDKCANLSNVFYYCYLVNRDVDLTSWQVGNTTAISNCSSCFTYAGFSGLNISGWKLNNVGANISGVFAYLKNLRTLNLLGCEVSNATTFYQMFYGALSILEINIENFNFSKITDAGTTVLQYFCYNNYSLKKFTATNCTPASGMTIKDTSSSYGYIFYNCVNLEYLDASWLDMSIFTGTYAHLYGFRSLYQLKTFIPPLNITKSFYMANSNMLSHDSIMAIIDNLVDLTGKTKLTLTLGTINLNKLTAEEKAVATNKNWTLA